MRASLISGVSGPDLTPDEISFYKSVRPAGTILFARNCKSHDQIKRLVADIKQAIGAEDVLVLIDQEGGRVQRLRPPLGRALPPAAAYARLYPQDPKQACQDAFAVARLLADDLTELGINTDCAPVLDLPVDGAHDIIGDRAYGRDPAQIIALAGAVAKGFMAGGVVPVIKHIPGHGRATCDSHLNLPVVNECHDELSATDFVTFKALAHLPAAMTAHVVFNDIDPKYPASTSAKVTADVIRCQMGFDGLLMSDDLSMKALSGEMSDRAKCVLGAGSDVALHCNGDMAEMTAAAQGVGPLQGEALRRFEVAIGIVGRCDPYDKAEAEAALERALRAA